MRRRRRRGREFWDQRISDSFFRFPRYGRLKLEFVFNQISLCWRAIIETRYTRGLTAVSHLVLWKTSLASKIRFEALWQSKAVRRCINWCLVAFARLVGAFLGSCWSDGWNWFILWFCFEYDDVWLFLAVDERFNDDYDPSIGGYGGNGEDKIVLIHVVFYRWQTSSRN